MKDSKNIAIAIPALNEEQVLQATLDSVAKIVPVRDIYLVDDASTDKTNQIASNAGVNILRNPRPMGKVTALDKLIDHFQLIQRYYGVLFVDADTLVDKEFLDHALPLLDDPQVACVAGQVKSKFSLNLFVVYRTYSYFLWQEIYKRILSRFSAVTIAPGTASLYKSSVLDQLDFDPSLIIEDFDMTFQVHRKKLGKIVYAPSCVVKTQDPNNLQDYFKQIRRWQLGMLQTVLKHRVPLKLNRFEIALLALFMWEMLHSLLLIVSPLIILAPIPHHSPKIVLGILFEVAHLIAGLVTDYYFLMVPALLILITTKRKAILVYTPLFFLIQYLHIAALALSIKDVLFKNIAGAWQSPTRR